MAKRSILFAAFIFTCLTIHVSKSFSLNIINAARTQQPTTTTKTTTTNILQLPQQPSSSDNESSSHTAINVSTANPPIGTRNNLQQSLLNGCIFFLTTTPLSALAAAEDLEVAELPPVYVPVIFAIAILGGVGVLTASLGNVMDEEASLGLQSGARAKKERDRTRSSYFKK